MSVDAHHSVSEVESVLREHGRRRATGRLQIFHPDARESSVHFEDGQVTAVTVPGRRPLLGVRLMSSGIISPDSLSEALEAQKGSHRGLRLGEILVALGLVERRVVTSFVMEQVHDQLADLLDLPFEATEFDDTVPAPTETAPPAEVGPLIVEAKQRRRRWADVLESVGGPEAVPNLGMHGSLAAEIVLGPHDWALLCKVDGMRTISDLAEQCGFTVFEAGQVVADLSRVGLVEVDDLFDDEDDEEPEYDGPLADVLPLHPHADVVEEVVAVEPEVVAVEPEVVAVEPEVASVEPEDAAWESPIFEPQLPEPSYALAEPEPSLPEPSLPEPAEDFAALLSTFAHEAEDADSTAEQPADPHAGPAYQLSVSGDAMDFLRQFSISPIEAAAPEPPRAQAPSAISPELPALEIPALEIPLIPAQASAPVQPELTAPAAELTAPAAEITAPQPAPAQEVESPPEPDFAGPIPMPQAFASQSSPADMASLIRELTSLGALAGDDAPPPRTKQTVTRVTPPPPEPKKKRRFGL